MSTFANLLVLKGGVADPELASFIAFWGTLVLAIFGVYALFWFVGFVRAVWLAIKDPFGVEDSQW